MPNAFEKALGKSITQTNKNEEERFSRKHEPFATLINKIADKRLKEDSYTGNNKTKQGKCAHTLVKDSDEYPRGKSNKNLLAGTI
ncbi:hypothetical protein SDC9_169140 [bioreactor metagenome]|uniref:Uncharacterized protein n=1 Tax=bioreactor metagenome TaxID=1076179 RepID=A0A645G714_9ZZZZ